MWKEWEQAGVIAAFERKERFTAIKFERADFTIGMSIIREFCNRDNRSGVFCEKL